ncbi:MAG: AAA family ATPase [Proteobacteria bacterium]|nr:AAA family ATPase [Pseudomonadota bacterium]TDJ35596.1 MAG: FHA domain-containing protein [Gammaproteobacteria bacterium]
MSYLQHFNLTQQPFNLTPDPEFVYWSKQHARAKAYMESTIWLADGFVVITGEIGSGKTTLLQTFLNELEDDVVYAVVSQTQLTPTQFLQAVLTEFGFKPFKKRKVELLDMLNMFLIEQYANGKKVLLIVDEAQNLGKKVLEEIRLLSGIETQKEKVLRIILAGQPELKNTLDSPRLKQLVQRVRLRFHIESLNRREMREYIEHRLSIAGREEPGPFTENAYPKIFLYSGGIPRLINTLCDTAMLCAFADEKKSIDEDDVISAVEELNWKEHESATGRYRELPKIVLKVPKISYLTKIEVHSKSKILSEHFFGPGKVIVGRAPDNELYIKSKFVSRRHAQITNTEFGCTIEDLNSTNGISIDNRRVKKYLLRDGDVVKVGMHRLVYTDLREVDKRDIKESVVSEKQAL